MSLKMQKQLNEKIPYVVTLFAGTLRNSISVLDFDMVNSLNCSGYLDVSEVDWIVKTKKIQIRSILVLRKVTS